VLSDEFVLIQAHKGRALDDRDQYTFDMALRNYNRLFSGGTGCRRCQRAFVQIMTIKQRSAGNPAADFQSYVNGPDVWETH
jgi:hypothetical protein